MKLSLDFAFEGFRIVRERPSIILFWGLLTLIGYGASTLIIWTLGGDAMAQMEQAVAANDMPAMMAAYSKIGPAYLLALPLNFLIQAVIACAVFRTVLNDGPQPFGGLTFGMDEIRQIGVSILFYLIFMGIYIVALIPGIMLGGGFSAALGGPATPAGMVGVFIGLIPTLLFIFFMISRLSLCFVQSFEQKKVNMFGSWKLTQGNAGILMLGYFAAIVTAGLVFVLCFMIFGLITVAASGGDFAALEQMEASARLGIEGLKNPLTAIYLVVSNGIVAPLLMAISFGAPAAAYRRLTGGGPRAENVF